VVATVDADIPNRRRQVPTILLELVDVRYRIACAVDTSHRKPRGGEAEVARMRSTDEDEPDERSGRLPGKPCRNLATAGMAGDNPRVCRCDRERGGEAATRYLGSDGAAERAAPRQTNENGRVPRGSHTVQQRRVRPRVDESPWKEQKSCRFLILRWREHPAGVGRTHLHAIC
jgi:hypothetical protein